MLRWPARSPWCCAQSAKLPACPARNAAYARFAMGAEAAGPQTAPQVSAARWSAHPVVRRDRQRYNQTCRDAPVPTTSLARVLLVDGRCVCINNGIGNLFGDYTVWFVTAALSGRRLFIDWKDTATNETVFRGDEAECLASTGGARCRRVHKRFDLSELLTLTQTPGPTLNQAQP